MNIHGILRTALADAATALAVPLFWEGEIFAPPLSPHLVAHIVIERAEAASLGSRGFTRTDGALAVDCVTVSGQGDAQAVELARKVSAKFPRGTLYEMDDGELTITTPVSGPTTSDGRRLSVPLKIPFYAFTQEVICP